MSLEVLRYFLVLTVLLVLWTAGAVPGAAADTLAAATPAGAHQGSAQAYTPLSEAVLLQGFGWESHSGSGGGSWWAHLTQQVPDIQAAGFTHVWLPPPSQSVAPQGYMPGQLYNLASAYGSKEELLELNRELRAAGIQPVGDIVINHRCADQQDDQGRWMVYRDDVEHPGRRIDWGFWAIPCNDPAFPGQGAQDTGEDFLPAPDLDHTNQELRESLADWMSWLHSDVGFGGWRFDFVKGYAASYIAEYSRRTLDAGGLCVGENWVNLRWSDGRLDYNQDEAISQLSAWLDQAGNCTLFDFAAKGITQEAVLHTEFDRLRGSQGRGPGLLGVRPDRAVTFVDNHDTASPQAIWPWPSSRVMLGYAFILTHPGIPCVFYDHMFGWGLHEPISQLIAIRRRNGIVSESVLEILAAEKDMYVARVNDRVVVKLGPRLDMGDLLPNPKEWSMAASGPDYAAWELRAT